MRARDNTEPVERPARKSRCPKCGKLGMRRFCRVGRNGVYVFDHGRVPSKYIPGVFEGIQCIVSAYKLSEKAVGT